MPKKRPATIKTPAADEQWKDNFKSSSFRTSFGLHLSQPMIEFICAVADDVTWDRRDFCTIHKPDNWVATEAALKKRGLIVRKEGDERRKAFEERSENDNDISYCKLTPAGEAVVQLFRVTGIFVEADSAITKKYKRG